MPLEPGQRLLHYRLIERIGEGGMGVVWKAEDTRLRRHVAVKALPAAMAGDPERRARFEREARAVAALNHPHIVTLYSVEEGDVGAESVHFITMELVEGRTLGELLPRGGFGLERLLEIAIPLVDAVSRAHRAGITHRDLKPDNIMIDREGRLRVLDFGLAKLREPAGEGGAEDPTITSDTVQGRIMGTAAYMSPEQAEGKDVDARSDVFSLGTILYEMATGVRPFQGGTAMSTIGAILKEEPAAVTERKPALPWHAGRIVRRCLAKNPDRRYQTALDLRNELEELKAEAASGVHEAGGVVRGRSRKQALVLAAAVLVAAMILTNWPGGGGAAAEYMPVPIIATSAYETEPSWSPRGRFIAFQHMAAGSFDIWVKPVDGGEAVPRAEGPGDQLTPRWTPDGSYLTYVSMDQPGSPVVLVPVDGGEPQQLIATNLPTLSDTQPMGDRPWSDDGGTLLISMPTGQGRFAVHAVDRATGEAEQITFPTEGDGDSYPTYSFDGRKVIFRREIGTRGALMQMPAEGGDPEVLLGGGLDVGMVAWRPDNRRIVFVSRGDAIENLHELDVATGEVRPLTNGTQSILTFSVSEDDRIAYAPFWHEQLLHVVDVETGDDEPIIDHAGSNGTPRFAPDGTSVVYVSDRTGNLELWLHHLDGRPETRFTDNEALDFAPDWSPDGRRLVFFSDREDGHLFVANADGATEPRRLVDQAIRFSPSEAARWSPDRGTIAYRVLGSGGPELWTVGADDRVARKRLDGVQGFDWYDEGRMLVLRTHGTEAELLAVDLEAGFETSRRLFVGPVQDIDVAPDGSAVAFNHGGGHFSMGLAVLRLEAPPEAGGLPRAAGDLEYVVRTEGTFHIHGGSWSPDSRRLVYVRDTDHGNIYQLVPRR